jgi:hypothetical protein
MNPDRKQLDAPYTKDEIDTTNAAVTTRVRDCVSSVILSYLHEFHPEYTHDKGAESIVESVLPVVFCLMEDSMLTGRYIAEEKIVKMLKDAGAIKMQPVSASNLQN